MGMVVRFLRREMASKRPSCTLGTLFWEVMAVDALRLSGLLTGTVLVLAHSRPNSYRK